MMPKHRFSPFPRILSECHIRTFGYELCSVFGCLHVFCHMLSKPKYSSASFAHRPGCFETPILKTSRKDSGQAQHVPEKSLQRPELKTEDHKALSSNNIGMQTLMNLMWRP